MWLVELHSCSDEKHNVKRYAYLRVRKLHRRVASRRSWLMEPCSLTTPRSWRHFAVQNELPRSSVPLYVIVHVTISPLFSSFLLPLPPKPYVWHDYKRAPTFTKQKHSRFPPFVDIVTGHQKLVLHQTVIHSNILCDVHIPYMNIQQTTSPL